VNQGFIPCSLHTGQNELAGRVHQLRFPGWLLLVTHKVVSFIRLQFGNQHILHFLFMILLAVFFLFAEFSLAATAA